MARIFNSVQELIGGTPLLRMNHIMEDAGIKDVEILGKLELFNPAGSAKDRIALQMILDAEEQGILKPGGTIIEPTSGNTGIGLASVAAARGYKAILTLPDTMSVERRNMLAAYGARLVLTEGAKGIKGAVEKAEELHREIPGSMILGQFVNLSNVKAHELTTGPEIWKDSEGKVDIFVAGVGTGGTITGTGRYLKAQNPKVRVVAVEPADSPLLSGGEAGSHGLQGIGANFIPDILDKEILDEIIPVTTQEAFDAGRKIARREGVLTGITSGAVMHAALLLAKRPENKGKTIVALLPDSGDRYLSSPMFAEAE